MSVARPLAEILFGEFVFGEAEDRELLRQEFVAGQVVERGQQLARGEIAGRAEDHHDAAVGDAALVCAAAAGSCLVLAGHLLCRRCCSMWPPNCLRMAESIFSAKVCSCRDRKRT